MATVYRARDVRHDRNVAIKVLDPVVASAVGEERFLRETRIVGGLQHLNIVPIFDSGSADGFLFFVMPLLEGETLGERLQREGPLPLAAVKEIVEGVAAALRYAHEAGVVHRDIKPANIMLTDSGPVVLDFGVARAVARVPDDRLTRTGLVVGTVPYMSPEQNAGLEELDGRSDQYSLACVAYEMLVGEPPFSGSNAQVVAARHALERPPSVAVVRPDLPAGVDEAIARALAKAPADRFEDIEAFAHTLRSARGAAPRRRVRRFALAGVAAASIALLVVLSTTGGPPLDRARVVGFPLADIGAPGTGSITGTDIGLWLGIALEQAFPLRWYDGWHWLSPAERDDPGTLTAEQARAIALGRGAAHYLTGILRHGPDSIRVVLRLWDTAGDSLVQQASAAAEAGSFGSRMALGALNSLLPRMVDPGRRVDLRHLVERDPAAVASWLQGEREYRNSRFESALTTYRDALQRDSLVAAAALKGAQAASWLERRDLAATLVERALIHHDLLTPPQHALAQGIRGYLTGDFRTADSALASATALDPLRAEMWMARAEVHHHLVPPIDSDFDATAAFERADELDPDFLPPLFHLVEIDARSRDVDRVNELVARLSSSDPSSTFLREASLLRQCLVGEDVDWIAAADTTFLAVREASRALLAGGALPECGEAASRAVMNAPDVSPGDRWGAVKTLHGLLMAQGRIREAVALADTVLEGGVPQAGLLHLLSAAQGADVGGRDVRFNEVLTGILEGQYGPDYRSTAQPSTLWTLAIWHAARGDRDEVARLARGLGEMAAGTEDASAGIASRAVDGWWSLSVGDTARAVRAFESLEPMAPPNVLAWELVIPLGAERLALARLLHGQGRHEQALRVASSLDHPQPVDYLPYLGASLALRADAAHALGRSALGDAYRARLNALVLVQQDIIPNQGGAMWLWIILVILVLCCIWHWTQFNRVAKWIKAHEPWMQEHWERGVRIETALCALEYKVYEGLDPSASDKFCKAGGGGPGDGYGGSPPPDGF
jgi:tetratricopeptide (TPR) repeat protein